MNQHHKTADWHAALGGIRIASFDGSTVKPRVPASMDGILDELEAKAMDAVEGRSASDRKMVARPGRAA